MRSTAVRCIIDHDIVRSMEEKFHAGTVRQTEQIVCDSLAGSLEAVFRIDAGNIRMGKNYTTQVKLRRLCLA